jgi:hypothetical protein
MFALWRSHVPGSGKGVRDTPLTDVRNNTLGICDQKMIEEQEVHEHAREIERIIREVESITDPDLRENVATLIDSLLSFHAGGIASLMQIIGAEGDKAAPLLRKIAGDPLVANLLLLYGVHPLSFETRVRHAIDRLSSNPTLKSSAIELLGITDRVVRIRLVQQDKHGCHSPQQIDRSAIEEALYEAAPDIDEIQFVDDVQQTSVSFVPLDSVRGRNGLTRTLNRTLPRS